MILLCHRKRMDGSLYRAKKYITHADMIYIYKSQIRTKHCWADAAESSLSSLRSLEGDKFFSALPLSSYRRNVIRLLLFYHGCSDELNSFVSIIAYRIRNAMFTVENQPHSLHVYLIGMQFPLIQNLYQNCCFVEETPEIMLPLQLLS